MDCLQILQIHSSLGQKTSQAYTILVGCGICMHVHMSHPHVTPGQKCRSTACCQEQGAPLFIFRTCIATQLRDVSSSHLPAEGYHNPSLGWQKLYTWLTQILKRCGALLMDVSVIVWPCRLWHPCGRLDRRLGCCIPTHCHTTTPAVSTPMPSGTVD